VTASLARLVRDGVALHVDDGGGPGTPVVFQHGLCGDARQTAEVFPPLPAFRRLTLECRGHGRSEAGDPTALTIATFADDVAAVIEALGSGAVVVGGISMGVAIALRLAVRRPDLVRGLVLARPAWVTRAAPDNMRPNAEVGRLLATLPPAAAREAFLRGPTARRLAEHAPDNLASLTTFFDREPLAVTAALLQAIAADGPGASEREVGAIRVPTLVLGTDHDLIHPMAHAEAIAALIPGARLAAVTSKAESRARYVADVRAALRSFLEDIP
jgi:pimeloyl-ACP methyl ester carboxylesterase